MKVVLFGSALITLGILAIACGDSGGDDGTSGDGSDVTSGSVTSGSSSFTCCLNGKFHTCPSSAAVSKCSTMFDTSDCTRDASKDNTCM